MTLAKQEIDVARKVKAIEYLKAQLVGTGAQVLFSLLEGEEQEILASLADLMLTGFILAKRCGVDFAQLDRQLLAKAREHAQSRGELEKWYGDYSSLVRYLLERSGQIGEGKIL